MIYSNDEFKMKCQGIYQITWQGELPFIQFNMKWQGIYHMTWQGELPFMHSFCRMSFDYVCPHCVKPQSQKRLDSFSKAVQHCITFHPTQPIQISIYGLKEISGEEEIFIWLNSKIVPLNTMTKTAKIITCNEAENIKVIDNVGCSQLLARCSKILKNFTCWSVNCHNKCSASIFMIVAVVECAKDACKFEPHTQFSSALAKLLSRAAWRSHQWQIQGILFIFHFFKFNTLSAWLSLAHPSVADPGGTFQFNFYYYYYYYLIFYLIDTTWQNLQWQIQGVVKQNVCFFYILSNWHILAQPSVGLPLIF